MCSNGELLLGIVLVALLPSRVLSSSEPQDLDLSKLNATKLKREQLAARCADIAHEDGAREVSLFEDGKWTDRDCCLLQFEDDCRSFCGSKEEALLDGRVCDYLAKRLHTYQDNLFACAQVKSAGRPCDLVRSRAASDEPNPGGGGSGMPIWLIVLLVVLIIVGIVMIIIVVRLFNDDKEQKKGSSRSRASTTKQSRRNSRK